MQASHLSDQLLVSPDDEAREFARDRTRCWGGETGLEKSKETKHIFGRYKHSAQDVVWPGLLREEQAHWGIHNPCRLNLSSADSWSWWRWWSHIYLYCCTDGRTGHSGIHSEVHRKISELGIRATLHHLKWWPLRSQGAVGRGIEGQERGRGEQGRQL